MKQRRSIFITGAASGIGRATAVLFAQKGWFVGLFDVNEDGLAGVAKEIAEKPCCHQRLDITDRVSYQRALEHFAERTGKTMDVLFNCAGIAFHGPFESVALDDHLRILEVNVKGTIIGIHLSLELLRSTPGAKIINMSSASAFYGTPDLAVYSASKFAIRGLTEALDIELEHIGISVGDIMPLFVDTPMNANQAYKLGSLSVSRSQLTPLPVAQVVWKAAHKKKVHWSLPWNVKIFREASRLFPVLQRPIMKLVSGKGI
jgi:NAD(P)-dependent dehydrogenase (short-subunit alcohol dehydrogenase family)